MFRSILEYFGFLKSKPKITVELGETDEDNQIQEYHCYKDGEYSHSVNMHYFTREQFDEMKKHEK